MIEENIGWDKLASLTDRAVCQAKISGGKIAYGLANHTVEVFNPVSKKIETLKTGHTKRLNCVSDYDTNILTCGNDGAVKLFDERIFKQVCHFKKSQQEFFSAAMSEHIVAAGGSTSLHFWDVRSKGALAVFEESFTEQVTGLDFNKQNKSTLYSCSHDGLINCFDLTQPNEQQSLQWSMRLDNPVKSVQTYGSHQIAHTTDHHLALLRQGDVVKKVQINSPDLPKHLFESRLYENRLEYIVWNINSQVIQKYVNDSIVSTASHVQDIDFLTSIDDSNIIISNDTCSLLLIPLTKDSPQPATTNAIEEQYDHEQVDEEGFVRQTFRRRQNKNTYRPF